jgi:hypothetical protein
MIDEIHKQYLLADALPNAVILTRRTYKRLVREVIDRYWPMDIAHETLEMNKFMGMKVVILDDDQAIVARIPAED